MNNNDNIPEYDSEESRKEQKEAHKAYIKVREEELAKSSKELDLLHAQLRAKIEPPHDPKYDQLLETLSHLQTDQNQVSERIWAAEVECKKNISGKMTVIGTLGHLDNLKRHRFKIALQKRKEDRELTISGEIQECKSLIRALKKETRDYNDDENNIKNHRKYSDLPEGISTEIALSNLKKYLEWLKAG